MNDKKKCKIRQMRQEGLKISVIANKTGYSKGYISQICKDTKGQQNETIINNLDDEETTEIIKQNILLDAKIANQKKQREFILASEDIDFLKSCLENRSEIEKAAKTMNLDLKEYLQQSGDIACKINHLKDWKEWLSFHLDVCQSNENNFRRGKI